MSAKDYYRARYYDASNGRFISEDPIGFDAGDGNLTRYVGNSPTNFRDPSGLIDEGKLADLRTELEALTTDINWCRNEIAKKFNKELPGRPVKSETNNERNNNNVRNQFNADERHSPPPIEEDYRGWLTGFNIRRGDYEAWRDGRGGRKGGVDWKHRDQMRQWCREIEKQIQRVNKQISDLKREKAKEENEQRNQFKCPEFKFPEFKFPEFTLSPIPIGWLFDRKF
jgi:uncharacterized protein RhaS with RHS repeats